MRKTWIVCLLSGLFIAGSAALLLVEAKAAEESISGRNYLAIEAAAVEFARQGLDISRYRITVHETEASLFVTFIDADVPDEQRRHVRGNPGKIPGFEVQLKRDNFQVVRSNFTR
jgi:hypothetical protein